MLNSGYWPYRFWSEYWATDYWVDAITVSTTAIATTLAPTTSAPSTSAPTTEAPTTEAPTTEAPTTQAPTTEAPTTSAPTTEAPTTSAPTTEGPTTLGPTTEPPCWLDDSFTGSNGDPPNESKWNIISGTPQIQNNTLELVHDGTADIVETVVNIVGDFDIQVDFEFQSPPSSDSFNACLFFYASATKQFYVSAARYSGTKAFQSGFYNGGVWNYRGESRTNDWGKLRITRSGSTVTFYYRDGSGAWDPISTSETLYSDAGKISLTVGSWDTNPTITNRFDNFIVNEGCPTEPTTAVATTEAPTTQAPTTEAPTTETPTTEGPTTEAPTTEGPTTGAPTTEALTTEAPTTTPPTTEGPTTSAPTTSAPTTQPPTTIGATTELPTTALITTQVPTTSGPITLGPTTLSPTTLAPTTDVLCEREFNSFITRTVTFNSFINREVSAHGDICW